ncbi:MAG TPA: hypothetical protein VJ739_01960, partial [Gemmataceae bacterium]|nr:hypothetical protein [Gemmataceae bacterium]
GGDKGQAAPKPKTAEEAQQDLRSAADSVKQARRGLRGLIGEGGALGAGGVRRVKFVPDPVPVMVATVTYYRPSGR